jgi:hypothetical protein
VAAIRGEEDPPAGTIDGVAEITDALRVKVTQVKEIVADNSEIGQDLPVRACTILLMYLPCLSTTYLKTTTIF